MVSMSRVQNARLGRKRYVGSRVDAVLWLSKTPFASNSNKRGKGRAGGRSGRRWS